MIKSTPIQARIQDSVTNGRGYACVNYASGNKTQEDLSHKLMAMEYAYPRTEYLEPSVETAKIKDLKSEPVIISRKESAFGGLVPIGFTASRNYDGSTNFVRDSDSQYFYI